MARENQGLHIALIIFVTLTLVLGVTTFVFFRKFEEATLKAKASDDQTQAANLKAQEAERESTELKRVIGFAATDKIDAIHEEVNKEMETYAANFEENSRDYRKVLKYLFEVIRKKDTSLAEIQLTLDQQKLVAETVEARKAQQVEQFKTAQQAAQTDLAGERVKFNEDRQAITTQKSELAAKLDKAQKDAVAMVDKIRNDLAEHQKRMQQVTRSLQDRSDQLKKITESTFEDADGKIRWVNQRNGTVWVNLGQSDGLPRQTTFAVYTAEATDMAKAEKKASIEVTQILGEHLAEARILEDSITDPILPGDLIHTPIWTPGEHQRFALTDGMDVDGDGKADRELVRNLITMTGGLIVAEMDDKSGQRAGKMDTNTRFLILGKEHDENTPKAVIEARTKMIREADTLGVQKVPLSELLKRMGWRNQAPVVRYGPGANPADFRPQPQDGITRESGGSVSPIFQPRNPPRSNRGSAY